MIVNLSQFNDIVMNIQERTSIIIKLGKYLSSSSESWQKTVEQASYKNGWFIPQFIKIATTQIVENFLQPQVIENVINKYKLDDNISPKTVGVVMAGNIPMVGFHDMLCVFLCGHYQVIKLSSKDDVLIKAMVDFLYETDERTKKYISIAPNLKGCDAYIATGGSNAAKTFDEYFGKYPSIIRKNKTSVAILNGNESPDELAALATDIHLYFGLGCRNVTKIYVPKNYDFVPILQAFNAYGFLENHDKYKNNYDYQLAILLLNYTYYMTNNTTLLVESEYIFSPISQLHYQYYENETHIAENLIKNQNVQCIVGNNYTPFGDAQKPSFFNYADSVDTMQFLLTL
jgi:hypothetical protein